MADKRKLQGEIDRCLKKVSEGVETFDDIWQKVQTAANANQKEKYEADLKKEIKKLQRLRDQIKTWLTSNDIKDKSSLMENRKTIETRMEKFKIVERETKTKAYSKEGLGLATKIDPAQKEKDEVRQWLTDSIAQLQMQIDAFESEIESLHVGTKRKKLDRDKQDRVDELTGWVERHKFHILKLETMMRMLDNCSLNTEDVKSVQDDLVYYIECNQEPDFAEDELIYDDLYLDDLPGGVAVPGTEEDASSIASSPTSTGPLSPKTPTAIKSTSQELFEDRRRGKTASISSDQPEVPQSPRKPNVKPLSLNTETKSSKPSKIATPTSNKTNSLNRTNSTGSASNHVPLVTTPKALSQGPKSASQLPLLASGYAVVAGGSHNTTTAGSNTSPCFNMTSVSVALPTLDSTATTSIITQSSNTKTTPSFDTGSDSQHSRPHSGPMSLASQNSPSGSSSPSLSPSLAHSQESLPPGSVPPASQDSNVSIPSGPPSQSAPSPSNSYVVSVNTSPNGSSSGSQHTGHSYSPVNNPCTVSNGSGGIGTVSNSSTVSTGIISGVTAPSVTESAISVVGTMLQGTVTMTTAHPQSSDVIFGGMRSALTALPMAGNPPSVVTSFPLSSTDTTSFSPSSLGNYTASATASSTNNTIDHYGYTHGVSSAHSVTSSLSTLKDIATEAVAAHDLLEDKDNTTDSMLRPMLNPAVAAPGARLTTSLTTTSAGGTRLDSQMQPLLGVAPLGPVSLNQDKMYQLKMLEAAFKHLPEPSDSERVRPYLQRTPYPTPPYYHPHPPPHMDAYDFFQRLSIETLFFIFYYMEGTKAQYMAAKALKKLSWRFHTKYMTWFQRLEEPKTITDDYEMGTYIYFDYEKWSQRKKDGFTFEYRYLEDRDLP